MTIRGKRRICIAVGLLAALFALGIVGGMDWGDIPIGRGAALALGCEIVGAALLWKGGVLCVR